MAIRRSTTVRVEGDIAFIDVAGGMEAMVDIADVPLVIKYTWSSTPNGVGGYYARNNNNKIYMHRLIMNAPNNTDVDHKNHNTLDNRRENLKIVTHQKNMENRIGANRGSATSERNIYINKRNGIAYSYAVKIMIHGKSTSSKNFPLTDEGFEQAKAYAEKLRIDHMENEEPIVRYAPKSGIKGVYITKTRQGKLRYTVHITQPNGKKSGRMFPYDADGLEAASQLVESLK